MKVNAEWIVKLRKERSWTQDELAIASGLNLRTIQRVEKNASASLQTKKALAAALDIDTRDLDSEEITHEALSGVQLE
jgi:transcriptional regulator with XRE-family HTH domain